ncbi:melanoma antigen preferentially expressed in tumors-like [Tenrec ecaudatus]|uniref:melanoma antigen preferentially expressed in tumors-like n=1 Tax=Tenrec ecaudatus TaxID=94439 RepID=UPI003F59BBEB
MESMKRYSPPSLVDLASQSFLKDEASAIAKLRCLPSPLFLPLFKAAVTGRHLATLKVMVATWPFTRMPLGTLIGAQKLPQDILKAVLDGLDVLLAQKVHLGRYLCFFEATLDKVLTFLLKRVSQRQGQLLLCCRKLEIFNTSTRMEIIEKVLKMTQLNRVQEVAVNCTWELSTLARLAPLLGQMVHLRRLILSGIVLNSWREEDEVKNLVSLLASQLHHLHQLQELYLDPAQFLEGHVDQVFACLEAPLKTLWITECSLSESDFTDLSLCPSTKSLRSLNLSRIKLTGFNPQSLQVLLESASDTLQMLNLGGCGITDSQLKAILPALGHCSQLQLFRFYGIPVPVATLEGLLRHTLPLCKLQLLQFSIPLECYLDIQGPLQQEKLPVYMAKLKRTLQDLGKWNSLLVCQCDTDIDDHSITCIFQD